MPDNVHGSNGGPFDAGHRPRNGTNGSRFTGMQARPVRFDELAEPVDLVAVQADDELINALAAGMSVSAPGLSGYDADDRVAAILAAWKADVEVEPIPELVDLDTAVSTILAARPASPRIRHLAPVAAAAAFLVLAIGGVSVSSYNAQPDDALWAVSKVLYSERAESVEAAARVEEHIANAKEALVAGQPVVAAQELARAEADLSVVRPQEGQGELAEAQDFLQAKAAETPQGQSVNPATPLATEPSRQVPESVRETPSPSPGSPSATGDPRPSATSPAGSGPEVASTPDSGSDPADAARTNDTRTQQFVPEDSATAPTSTATPPSGNGNGEGDPDPTTGPVSPTATSEGDADPTTTPVPPPPGNGGEAPSSDGPAGSEPVPAG